MKCHVHNDILYERLYMLTFIKEYEYLIGNVNCYLGNYIIF